MMDSTVRFLTAHAARYPALQIEDVMKALFQSVFGCEHLIADASAAADFIRQEAASRASHDAPLIEPLDGAYCRVDLNILDSGLSADTFARLFALSAEPQSDDARAVLEKKLSVLPELISSGILPFDAEEAAQKIDLWRQAGFPACHHSEEFRAAYAPAYRLMKQSYAQFLPLFARIDQMLADGQDVTLAIDGNSGAGKSTLAQLLTNVYSCPVFHMDDFFLRPEQRTPERYAEPGGNVDRERFLEEVLTPLSAGQPVQYRRFDCQTFTILPPHTVRPGRLNVVEGSYSMHSTLAPYYDLSVFLRISPEHQQQRILYRNGPQMASRFFAEWIPMEELYFRELQVPERCQLVFDADSFENEVSF